MVKCETGTKSQRYKLVSSFVLDAFHKTITCSILFLFLNASFILTSFEMTVSQNLKLTKGVCCWISWKFRNTTHILTHFNVNSYLGWFITLHIEDKHLLYALGSHLEGFDEGPEQGPDPLAPAQQFDQPHHPEQAEEGDGDASAVFCVLRLEEVKMIYGTNVYSDDKSRSLICLQN